MKRTTKIVWVELQKALDSGGYLLIDVSSASRIPGMATEFSVSYLAQLRSGKYRGPGPNARVIKALAGSLGCTMDDLRPKNYTPDMRQDDAEATAA